jgi:hypothetical protein
VNPAKHGSALIEQFFDEHRDIRLYKIRLQDKGQEYLNSHKSDLAELLTKIDHRMETGATHKQPAKE